MREAARRVERAIPDGLTRIARDAEKQLKTDYLKRGGSFTRTKNKGRTRAGRAAKTKTSGYAWVKNPGQWLRWGTGALARSWRHFSARSVGVLRWQSGLQSHEPVKYARIHEFGGQAGVGHSVKIPKRSYIQPMINDNRATWAKWLGEAVRASFK